MEAVGIEPAPSYCIGLDLLPLSIDEPDGRQGVELGMPGRTGLGEVGPKRNATATSERPEAAGHGDRLSAGRR